MALLPSSIKAIVFDAYGTLLSIDALDTRLEKHFGEQAKAINQVWRQKQLEYTWLRGLMQEYRPFSTVTAEALEFACLHLGIQLTPAIKEDLVRGYFELTAYGDVKASLERLGKSYSLAVLSNADPAMLTTAMEYNQLSDHLQAILSVDAVQMFKPHPSVYQIAVDQFKLSPSEIAFVSSNTWDISGSAAFGLTPVWLNRFGKTMDTLGYSPSLTIHSLADLS
ncbi:MAG: haloacid dehalogenase type II [Bacteroidota bacterium]